LVLALLWFGAALLRVGARYSWDWDSSQFDRAVEKFDVKLHQPHPPGYPLWVLAMKGLTPILGNPNSAQVLLSLLFTVAGLLFFALLSREALGREDGLTATALLAFSPLVFLYAIVPLATSVDLFASCSIAWLSARIWSGERRWILPACIVAAITAGFRESGITLVLPLLLAAMTRCVWLSRGRNSGWKAAMIGIAAGVAVRFCWLIPAAGLNGGLSNWYRMANVQMMASFRQTSVLWGASVSTHGRMLIDVLAIFAIALSVLIPLSLASRSNSRDLPVWCSPVFLALWLTPNLIVVFLLHCGKPGYILLSLPPLVLAALRRRSAGRLAMIGVAIGILVSFFPYDRVFKSEPGTIGYLLLRSSPRFAYLLEDAQVRMRGVLDALSGPPSEKLMISDIHRPEAPNIRTVTFDFRDLRWTDDPRMPLEANVRTVVVLCDRREPSPILLERFPNLQRVFAGAGFALWTASSPIQPSVAN
jgi:hypothetical protein